jgi:hypothetical protein
MSGNRPVEDEPRYAIYFVPPPGSPLACFGAVWLGYDVANGAEPPQPRLPEIAPERLRNITAEPRRYGFHATLKPPFSLAAGATAEELGEAVGPAGARCRGFYRTAAPSGEDRRVLGACAVGAVSGSRCARGDMRQQARRISRAAI